MNDGDQPIVPARCDYCGEIAPVGVWMYRGEAHSMALIYFCHCEYSWIWREDQRTEYHFPTWRDA